MKPPITILFLFLTSIVNGQSVDSLKLLGQSTWRTEAKWFGSDTVIIIANPISASPVQINEQDLEWFPYSIETEQITFDSAGKLLYYSNYIDCPVGETIRELIDFRLINGQVKVKYVHRRWNQNNQEEKEVLYNVNLWTTNRIELELNATQ